MTRPDVSILKGELLGTSARHSTLLPDPTERSRHLDPRGHAIHTVAAAAYCFCVTLVQAPEAISLLVLGVIALLRLRYTWRSYRVLLRSPVIIAFLAWSGWTLASLLWSRDPSEGLDELRDFRVLLVPAALWPVLDRVRLFVIAFLSGIAVQNLVQLGMLPHAMNTVQEGQSLRVRGLLHPIQVGALAAAAIVWHLGAILLTRGRQQALAAAGLLLAAAGLMLSGSRGPWLSAAASAPLAVIWSAARFRGARKPALILIIMAALAGTGLWFTVGEAIQTRVTLAIEQWKRADEGNYASDVGLRVMLNHWAWRFAQEKPFIGYGAGSFRERVLASPEYAQLTTDFPATDPDFFAPGHAHSTPMHILATTGGIGGALFLITLALLAVNCLRDRIDSPWAPVHAFVLLGWVIGSCFDAYHLNAHLFGVFALLVTFTLPCRPPTRPALPLSR